MPWKTTRYHEEYLDTSRRIRCMWRLAYRRMSAVNNPTTCRNVSDNGRGAQAWSVSRGFGRRKPVFSEQKGHGIIQTQEHKAG